MTVERIGDFTLTWGESLLWDDQKQRLYFVDCDGGKLLWLEDASLPLHKVMTPSMPTGLALTDAGQVLIALEDGFYVFDPDNGSGRLEQLVDYPAGIGRRANDLTVDSAGAIVTGSLNEKECGSYWRYSSQLGWQQLDSGITNTNGPVVLGDGEQCTLVIADTPAQKLFTYDYFPASGVVEDKRVFANTSELNGAPDGACATENGEVLSTLLGPGLIALYSESSADDSVRTIDTGVGLPSDVCFGGPGLDRLFVTSISVKCSYGEPVGAMSGGLLEIHGTELKGRPEHRFKLG